MSVLEQGGGLGLNTQERVVMTGKVATDPVKTLDTKPTATLYLERQIPEDRKSLRYAVTFRGRSSQFILDSIRQGQEMKVHGFLVTTLKTRGMYSYPIYHIEVEHLELGEGVDIRKKPPTKPWFALSMPNPDLSKLG